MKRTYQCPRCDATLNPNVKIILRATSGARSGIILLSPQPGNYQVFAADELQLQVGDKVEFFCPVCQQNLRSRANENLAEIDFRNANGSGGVVDFSRIFGEHATYFVTRETVRPFGENADEYGSVNFFGINSGGEQT